jgi:hypothetical protein
MALNRHLAEPALAVLDQASEVDLGAVGAQLHLRLLLETGQLDKARERCMDEERGNLGLFQMDAFSPELPARLWYQMLVIAASGQYRDARAALDLLAEVPNPPVFPPTLREMLVSHQPPRPSLSSSLLTAGQVTPLSKPLAVLALERWHREAFSLSFLQVTLRYVQQRADLMVLRGLLALEEGDTEAAEQDFRKSLTISAAFGGRPAAERYLDLIAQARR